MAKPTPQIVSLPPQGDANRKALLELIDSTRAEIEAGRITDIAIASVGRSTDGIPSMSIAHQYENAYAALLGAVTWLQHRLASPTEDK